MARTSGGGLDGVGGAGFWPDSRSACFYIRGCDMLVRDR